MSDNIEIKGTVETILEIQEFSSGFKKRTIVVNTGGKYLNHKQFPRGSGKPDEQGQRGRAHPKKRSPIN